MAQSRSYVFTPLPGAADRPAMQEALQKVDVYREPSQDILLLGELWRDARTILELLPNLPFDDGQYTGNLRVVLGCSERIRHRCRRLLGETDDTGEKAESRRR